MPSMMTVGTAIFCIAVFAAALWLSGLLRAGAGALATAHGALAVLRDPAMDDAAREREVQRAALRLFGAGFSILLRGALALCAAALPLWLAEATGLAPMGAVMDFLLRWEVIVLATLVLFAAQLTWRRLCPPRPVTPR